MKTAHWFAEVTNDGLATAKLFGAVTLASTNGCRQTFGTTVPFRLESGVRQRE
ncbi:MAG: hypothetical protein EORIYHIE_001278 [Candidatus Fervidibacter sp.]|jgi:hypothetical protein